MLDFVILNIAIILSTPLSIYHIPNIVTNKIREVSCTYQRYFHIYMYVHNT